MATALITIPCSQCDNPTAKFHCDTCAKALCPQCKEKHLKDKATRHHVVVQYAKKLDPKYLTGLRCHTHNTTDPELWCKTCDVPICVTCITEKHNGHHCCKIATKLSEKRDAMLEETKALRDKTVTAWEEVLSQARRITTDFLANIDDIDKELVARAEDMRKQVDVILSQSQQTLQQMKNSGLAKLKKQEKHLADKIENMKADVVRCENQLLDANPNILLKFEHGTLQTKETPPPLETTSLPAFTRGENNTDVLEKIFGHLPNINVSEKSSESQSSTKPIISSDAGILTHIEQPDSSSSATQRSLIPTPSVLSQFDVRNRYPLIACVEGGLAWVETEDKKLQLVDREGAVKDTIKIEFEFYDTTITSDGTLILPDYDNRCIKSVSSKNKFSTMLKTSWKPYSLCCLNNGDIVVAFNEESKVTVYSSNGNIRQTLDHIKFRYPMKVTVNKVNQDIYICDHIEEYDESPGKVIAVGADGQLQYEYSGQGDTEFKFTPVEVCTDQIGHILIPDFMNHRVHILEQEGQFIQYILTSQQGLHHPEAIDVDREGYMWVGQYSARVKVVRYLQ